MKTIIDNQIFLMPKDNAEKKFIRKILKEKLTFVDPASIETKRHTGFIQTIQCYRYEKADNRFVIPRGRTSILDVLFKSGITNEGIVDKRKKNKSIDFKANFDFRDHIQKNAFDKFVGQKLNMGILNLACGLGKSFVAIKIIEHIKLKPIILVDEIYLAQQWLDYFRDWTDVTEDDICLITGKSKKKELNKLESSKIIIASKDSLVNKTDMIDKIKKEIGVIVVDECHVASAKIFTEVVQKFNAKWILGLTASAQRDDGLDFLIENNVGKVIYKATIFDSVKLGSSILPELKTFFLKKRKPYIFKKNDSYHKMAGEALNDPYVVNFVSYIVMQHYMKDDSQLLITQKVDESKKIKDYLIKVGIPEDKIAVMLGETKPAERSEIIEKIKSGEIKIVISSKIFDKGVSANNLNILHNLYPSKQVANTIQRAGRISRTSKGKTYAIVYDYIYDHVIFSYQFYNKNKRIYRLQAYLQCTKVPDYTSNMVNYLMAYFKGKTMPSYKLGNLQGQLDQVIIDIDSFPLAGE